MSVFTRVTRGRLAAWLTLAAAIVVGAAVFGLPQPANPDPVSATGLSVEWQSTQVERLQEQLPAPDVQPAIIVISRVDGARAHRRRPRRGHRPARRPRPRRGRRPGRPAAGLARRHRRARRRSALHRRRPGADRRGGRPAPGRPRRPAGHADRRGHRRPRLHRRPHQGLRRRRRHPARGHRRGRRAPALDHLPQPVPVDRAAARRRGDRTGDPARRRNDRPGRRHQPPGGRGHRHHQRAGLRRRHRLRPAAHRPLPRGTAPRAGPLRGHALRATPHRGARFSPAAAPSSSACSPCCCPSRSPTGRSPSPAPPVSCSPCSRRCSCCPRRSVLFGRGLSGRSCPGWAARHGRARLWGRLGAAVARRPVPVAGLATAPARRPGAGRARHPAPACRRPNSSGSSRRRSPARRPSPARFPAGTTQPVAVLTVPSAVRAVTVRPWPSRRGLRPPRPGGAPSPRSTSC